MVKAVSMRSVNTFMSVSHSRIIMFSSIGPGSMRAAAWVVRLGFTVGFRVSDLRHSHVGRHSRLFGLSVRLVLLFGTGVSFK